MAAILALLPSIIAIIPTLTTGVKEVVGFISSVRTAAQQSNEWTPELEKAFMDALIARSTTEAWKPDAQ